LHDNELSVAPIRLHFGTFDTEMVSFVKRICAPLFIIFDYTVVPDTLYEQIVDDFLKGRSG